ncbi:MAG TPA: TetR/AcrR family transcriptional regulator [Epulopiscium sp.]|nr:TetR/AcrR family transcriptional regulator [Candidatus Epulonipiscium sp.]
MTLLQKARLQAITVEAKSLFLEKGIDSVTMADIASHLSIGEASLYRYFGKKQTLVIDSSILIWNEIYDMLDRTPLKTTGYENLESFYGLFLDVFQKHPDFFRFLEEFDGKILQSAMSNEELKTYEQTILKFKTVFDQFFQMGITDGTLKDSIDKELFYYTTSHSLIGLCKKLATHPHVLSYEANIQPMTQIACLIQVCLNYIH